MRLSIIIISYNTKDVTLNCLNSLADVTDLTWGTDFEVIVVDNGSKDESVRAIRQQFPLVKMIETGENLGFSKGNNVGVKATKPETEYVLFLNSDTTVPTGTLSKMLEHMDADSNIGLSTCKVNLWDGSFDWDSHRGFPTPWASLTRLTGLSKIFPKSQFYNQYNQGWKDLTVSHEVDSIVGAFMLIRRDVGEKIGWWDEDYFLNGEDIDMCFQTKKAGYKVMYFPDCSITHFRGASKGTRKEGEKLSSASRQGKVLVARSSVNAMQLFYDKHLRSEYNVMVNTAVDIGIWLLNLKRVFRQKLSK